jgi:hypothetical protein
MTTTINSLNAYSYSPLLEGTPGAGQKLFVPVQPSMVIHAQFDHVVGIPAAKGQGGVSLSKVHILNTLIDQLITVKGKPARPTADGPGLDALIDTNEAQLRGILQQARGNPFLLSGALPQSGQLLSLHI